MAVIVAALVLAVFAHPSALNLPLAGDINEHTSADVCNNQTGGLNSSVRN